MKIIILFLLTFTTLLNNIDRSDSSTVPVSSRNCIPADVSAARRAVSDLFENDRNDYPDFYAGCYITVNKKRLVVMFTADDTSEYDYLLEEHPCIIFRKAEYNLDELWEMYYDFEERNYYAMFPEIEFSAYVSKKYNCLEITVYPYSYTEENINKLEAALQDYPIRITEQGHMVAL